MGGAGQAGHLAAGWSSGGGGDVAEVGRVTDPGDRERVGVGSLRPWGEEKNANLRDVSAEPLLRINSNDHIVGLFFSAPSPPEVGQGHVTCLDQ